ncbi:MAG: argininosuccinate lyase, partial [Atribacterota bacterium]|nr:argininosuccinate lyase [Atribacterota bacterium]
FREAHRVVGEIVLYSVEHQKSLEQLTLEELQQFNSLFTADVFSFLTPEAVVNSKKSYGGTALERVRETIAEEEKKLNY